MSRKTQAPLADVLFLEPALKFYERKLQKKGLKVTIVAAKKTLTGQDHVKKKNDQRHQVMLALVVRFRKPSLTPDKTHARTWYPSRLLFFSSGTSSVKRLFWGRFAGLAGGGALGGAVLDRGNDAGGRV